MPYKVETRMITATMRRIGDVLKPRVFILPHGFLVIQQQDEKDQSRGQQRYRDHLHKKRDQHQGRTRNQHDRARQSQREKIIGIKPRRLPRFGVQRVGPAEDLAEGPGTRQRNADGAQQPGIEQPDSQERSHVLVDVHE